MIHNNSKEIWWMSRFWFSFKDKVHQREMLVGPFRSLDELNKWRLAFIGELEMLSKGKKEVSFFPYSEMVDEFKTPKNHSSMRQTPYQAAMELLAVAMRQLIWVANTKH